MNQNPIVYFDLETTGIGYKPQITQLSAVAMKGTKELGTFNEMFKFDKNLADPVALEIQNYSDERWKDAIEPAVGLKRFVQFLDRYKWFELISKNGKPYKVAQLSGYNAVAFDGPILLRICKKLGIFLPARMQILDVYQLALWYYEKYPDRCPENTKLGTVCESLGIPLLNAHDALADSRSTGLLANKILSRLFNPFTIVDEEGTQFNTELVETVRLGSGIVATIDGAEANITLNQDVLEEIGW